MTGTTERGGLKTIDDLPGPRLSTTLYWMIFKQFGHKMHLFQVRTCCGFACRDMTIVLIQIVDSNSKGLKRDMYFLVLVSS